MMQYLLYRQQVFTKYNDGKILQKKIPEKICAMCTYQVEFKVGTGILLRLSQNKNRALLSPQLKHDTQSPHKIF